MQFEHLFTPIKIGTRTAKNRIVFPCHGVAIPFFQEGDPTDGYIAYQEARARGGCGLNIIGPLVTHKSGMMGGAINHSPPATEHLIPKLKKMADAIHTHGSLVLLQLWLYGNQYMSLPHNANWGFTTTAVNPHLDRPEVCHEMTDTEIEEVLDSYAKYVKAAKESGLDGVEIHACHGSLVQQSWSPWANQRSDKWGQPMAFSTELAKRIKNIAGKESGPFATIKPAPKKKKVMVIGGGPAGMESARVAAIRGHQVTLYEKENQLGGQINTLIKAPGREEFSQVTRYLSTQLPKLGVKIKLGTEVTKETVKKEKPDAVIVATGARPYIEKVPGGTPSNVVSPSQVLNGEVTTGKKVVVYESTDLQEGPTVADFLAERGKKVELLTSMVAIGANWGLTSTSIGTHIPMMWQRLRRNGVNITPFAVVKSISGRTVTVADVLTGQESMIHDVDNVVMATGYVSENSLSKSLTGEVGELYEVGDCYAPKRALNAIHAGYMTAFDI